MYSPEKQLRGLSPIFHIHISVSNLYISAIGPPIFQQQKIVRPIVGIYKSLIETWMQELGMRPRSFISGNIFLIFGILSLQCTLLSNLDQLFFGGGGRVGVYFNVFCGVVQRVHCNSDSTSSAWQPRTGGSEPSTERWAMKIQEWTLPLSKWIYECVDEWQYCEIFLVLTRYFGLPF